MPLQEAAEDLPGGSGPTIHSLGPQRNTGKDTFS